MGSNSVEPSSFLFWVGKGWVLLLPATFLCKGFIVQGRGRVQQAQARIVEASTNGTQFEASDKRTGPWQ
jgi:hypothetical protein